jgi:hypothetical protein
VSKTLSMIRKILFQVNWYDKSRNIKWTCFTLNLILWSLKMNSQRLYILTCFLRELLPLSSGQKSKMGEGDTTNVKEHHPCICLFHLGKWTTRGEVITWETNSFHHIQIHGPQQQTGRLSFILLTWTRKIPSAWASCRSV